VSHVADDVTAAELPLRRLPLTLRCHVTALSANHVEPRVTVSLDGADVTSRFTRSMTLTSRSRSGDLDLKVRRRRSADNDRLSR